MVKLTLNKGKVIGKIKPMHAVNNYPALSNTYDEYMKELHLPYSRLHDTAFLNPHLVDYTSVFPNFDADENDEKSYDFAFTDFFLKKLIDQGTEPFYRLGVSIENYQYIKAYNIYPPKDFHKWARICEHIIMHYNEGWANGFHYNIKYWEIWNEPENDPIEKDSGMWKGTFDEFVDLYEIASKYLKSRFPDLKIGGYASCGFYTVIGEVATSLANVSSRYEYFVTCFETFLKRISEKGKECPLDFFSWHSYSAVKHNVQYARYVREMLDKYGFTKTESILDEWNASITQRGTLYDSSCTLSNMLALQNEKLDMLMYYDFRVTTMYCGAFNPITFKPFKTYYSFKAFGELYDIGRQIECDLNEKGVYAVAAYNGEKGAVVISNLRDVQKEFSVSGVTLTDAKMISEEKNLEQVSLCDSFKLNAYETIVLYFI